MADVEKDEIFQFCLHFDLSDYYSVLADSGVESLNDLKQLGETEITDLCAEASIPSEQQTKLVNACQQLKDNLYPVPADDNNADMVTVPVDGYDQKEEAEEPPIQSNIDNYQADENAGDDGRTENNEEYNDGSGDMNKKGKAKEKAKKGMKAMKTGYKDFKKKNKEARDGVDDKEKTDEIMAGLTGDIMFDGSTHQFFIYFNYTRNVNGLIISVFVILMQFVLYGVCANQALGALSGDEHTVPVEVRFGNECTDSTNLLCPPDVPALGYTALGAMLLAFFLMYDMLAALRTFATVPSTIAKVAAFIILFEAIFAAIVGALFAVLATSGYDAISNCVGILFIHDVDEKAYEAFMLIEAEKLKTVAWINKYCICCSCMEKCLKYVKLAVLFITIFAVMVLALIIGGAIRQSAVDNIKDEYGADWWDDNWSGGDFWADSEWDGGYY